jgi:putative FmdB family regulatory protein
MAMYQFTCPACGRFDVNCPMQDVTPTTTCPRCSGVARRQWTVPATRLVATGMRTMLDVQDASRHEPQVVSSVPTDPGRSRRITTDPRHRRLPRP